MWMHILKPHPLIQPRRGVQRTFHFQTLPAPLRHPVHALYGAPAVTTALVFVTLIRPNSTPTSLGYGLCCTSTSSAVNPSWSSSLSYLRVLTPHVAGQHLMCTSSVGRRALMGSWHDTDLPPSSSRFYPLFLYPPHIGSRESPPSNAHLPLRSPPLTHGSGTPNQLDFPHPALRSAVTDRTSLPPYLCSLLFLSVHADPTVTIDGFR
ncbi:hypothetical protein VUR80DRAFT_9875 [Thermomyces stellatus]